MSASDTTSVRITDLDWRARGLVRLGGRLCRLPGVLPGEQVTLSLDEHPNILAVDEVSADRVDAGCAQVAHCPGCQLRHANSDFSFRWRSERALHDLSSAGLEIPYVGHLLGQASRDGYRVRAVAHAMTTSDGELLLGMRGRRRSVELGRCPVQSPRCRELIDALERDLRSLGLRAYDSQTRTGELRHVVIDAPVDCGEGKPTSLPNYPRSRVTLCFGRPIALEHLADSVLAEVDDVAVVADILPFRSPSLFARPTPLRGGAAIDMRVGSDWLRASLPAWTPQTPETVPVVKESILSWLGDLEEQRVLEVGCGVGTNSLAIARIADLLVGVDSSRSAILDAIYNADRAGLDNCEFRVGEAEKALARILAKHGTFDAVVLHAMRRPFGSRAMAAIRQMSPSRVIYLGPSPRSIAEDLSHLRSYEITELGFIDQSPGTTGLLTLCALAPIEA